MVTTGAEPRLIAVTGAAGYIGNVVSSQLISSGYAVLGIDCLLHGAPSALPLLANRKFSLEKTDVTNSFEVGKILHQRQPRAVLHLAAVVGDPACKANPLRAEEVNFNATIALAEAAEDAGVERFVFVSTCSNYGIGSDQAELLNEDAPLKPLSKYAETKVRAEQSLIAMSRRSRMSIIILRFSTAHGLSSRMRFDLTVNEFTRDVLLGGGIEIYDADTWRPYCHVTDFGRALQTVLEARDSSVRGQVFNVGSNTENFRKSDLAEFALRLSPTAKISVREGGFDRRNYRVDFSKVNRELGFSCAVGVKDSMDSIAAALSAGAFPDPYSAEWRNA